MFRKDILKELSEPNDYYDRCYGCNKLNTDGWGDCLCTSCEMDKNQEWANLGVYFDADNNMHNL